MSLIFLSKSTEAVFNAIKRAISISFVVSLLLALVLTKNTNAQIGATLDSIDAMVAKSDLIVIARISEISSSKRQATKENLIKFKLAPSEYIKGEKVEKIELTRRVYPCPFSLYQQWKEEKTEFLAFLNTERRSGKGAQFQIVQVVRLSKAVSAEKKMMVHRQCLRPNLTSATLKSFTSKKEIINEVKKQGKAKHQKETKFAELTVHPDIVWKAGMSGDVVSLRVPVNAELENLCRQAVNLKKSGGKSSNKELERATIKNTRVSAIQILGEHFRSKENIEFLLSLLKNDEFEIQQMNSSDSKTEYKAKFYFIRYAAWEVLVKWKAVDTKLVQKPVLFEKQTPQKKRNIE